MKYRNLRVSELVKRELGKIMLKELEFGEALVTITEVEIDEKLEGALVWVSVIPETQTPLVLRELRKHRGELQFLLARKLNIKPMPQIRFELDRGPERAAQVEKILIKEQNKE